MRTLPRLFLLFITIPVWWSCDTSSTKSEISVTTDTTLSGTSAMGSKGNPVDYTKVKVIKSVYVTDRNGIDMKEQPNSQSVTLGQYEYGHKLDVIDIQSGWLGVLDMIKRSSGQDGKQKDSVRWEKVYVQERQTGDASAIKLEPKNLNIIFALTEKNQKTEYFEKGKPLTQYIAIQLISKETFLSKKATAISYLLADTNKVQKKNGAIELVGQQATKRFVDNPDAEEERQVYTYIGQYEPLNQYIISGTYYESGDYKFVDKTSGKVSQTFGSFPYVSADKKYIACVSANGYDNTADFELYTITEANFSPVVKASFTKWMPVPDENEAVFWGDDGFLYMSVAHANAYWKADGSLNNEFQYIQIRVL